MVFWTVGSGKEMVMKRWWVCLGILGCWLLALGAGAQDDGAQDSDSGEVARGEVPQEFLAAWEAWTAVMSEKDDLEPEAFMARLRQVVVKLPLLMQSVEKMADDLYQQGQYGPSGVLVKLVFEVSREVHGEEDPETLTRMNNLAHLLKAQGDLIGARILHEQALSIRRRVLGEAHLDTLMSMVYLASILQAQGDLSGARTLHEQALSKLRRALGEENPATLTSMSSLAGTLFAQGDLIGARTLHEQALSIRRRVLGETHLDTLTSMASLAIILQAQGDLSGARSLKEKALLLSRRVLGEEHPQTFIFMDNLAITLEAQGDLSGARALHEQAYSLSRRVLGDEHPDTLSSMSNVAASQFAEGNLEEARKLWDDILTIQAKQDGPDHRPGTELETVALHYLGHVHRKLNNREQSRDFFLRALASNETEAERADVSENVKAGFRERRLGVYWDAIVASLALDNTGEAFHTLERYRAQSLLTLLFQERKAAGQVPQELEAERREIAARYDAIFRQLDRLDPNDPEQHKTIQALRDKQSQLRRRREVNEATIRKVLVGDAAEATKPLTVAEAQKLLRPETLLLSFLVGPEKSHLFVLSRDKLDVHVIETSAFDLSKQLLLFLQLLRPANPQAAEESDLKGRTKMAKWLFKKLLGDAADRIAQSERLLILPDGPLHYLPFAALARETHESERGWQYLAEWKPIHIAASATVYAELRSRRDAEASTFEHELIAFGDPLYPEPLKVADGRAAQDHLPFTVRSAMERGVFDGLTRLVHSGHEVREIGNLFQDTGMVYERDKAREEIAKAEISNARYIHFAAHGLAHPFEPGDSWIALTLDDREGHENGLFQAWELTQGLKLKAELVVLSACVTARGPESGGEGILSLSRAFQIAGARTVAATLWSVNDASTAELMIRFYKKLIAGKPKNEALRAAQMEFITGPIKTVDKDGKEVERDFSAPYYWAAFQLYGDWE